MEPIINDGLRQRKGRKLDVVGGVCSFGVAAKLNGKQCLGNSHYKLSHYVLGYGLPYYELTLYKLTIYELT